MEQPVTLQSGGQQVVGMLHLPEGGDAPAPGVLFLHGFTGNKQEAHRLFVMAARALAARGVASLRIDFRGSGDSEGDFSEASIRSELDDARQALAFLGDRPEVDADRTALLGMSMGGLVAALLLAEKPRVAAACLWCPVAHPRDASDRRAGAGAAVRLAVKGVLDLDGWPVGRAFAADLLRVRPLQAVAGVTLPVLLVHGDADVQIPLQHSLDYERVLRDAGAPVALHVVSGAGHSFDTLPWQGEVVDRSVAWLCGQLRAGA